MEKEGIHHEEEFVPMNMHIDVEEHPEMDATLQTKGTETDPLARCGFSREEITTLRLSAAVVPGRGQ